MPRKIGWFDIKTKFKHIIRSVGYSRFFRAMLCSIIAGYMRLVFLTSKIELRNYHFIGDFVKNKQPVILAFWHSRIMMSPLIALQGKKINPYYQFYGLASAHGDGRFVGDVLEMFGIKNIFGSSQKKKRNAVQRQAGRGITTANFRLIFKTLKAGHSVTITPDGPRGPKEQVGGKIIKIAQNTAVPIIPLSYAASKFIRLNSWDNFLIPLPFGKICYYFDEPFWVDKNADEEKMNAILTGKINLMMKQAKRALNK